jgi:hypothetical protein
MINDDRKGARKNNLMMERMANDKKTPTTISTAE